jgi:uncharacterized protein (TIGR02611 family)
MDDDVTDRAERMIERAHGIYEDHGKVFRAMWILVGVVVLAAGLAMIVFPGPVSVVVPLGLAMLAAVFGWARRLLLVSVEKSAQAKERAEQLSTKAKVLGGAAAACLAAAAVVVFLALR